jgi:hypothetical protein
MGEEMHGVEEDTGWRKGDSAGARSVAVAGAGWSGGAVAGRGHGGSYRPLMMTAAVLPGVQRSLCWSGCLVGDSPCCGSWIPGLRNSGPAISARREPWHCGTVRFDRVVRRTEEGASDSCPTRRRFVSAPAIEDRFKEFLPHFLLSIHTGMRMSEQYGLDWGHVDFERRQIHLPKPRTETPERSLSTRSQSPPSRSWTVEARG